MKYYCIGEKLTHSLSKVMHNTFGNDSYELLEIKRGDLKNFLQERNFAGLNITVPYKETVMEYLDETDETAKKIGAVNTIVNRDGKLVGYNTDFTGFYELCTKNGIDVKNKKVMILGSGGTSKTVKYALGEMGAAQVYVVSRNPKSGMYSYSEAERLNPDILVNTTPVGMFPDTDKSPFKIRKDDSFSAVIDVIYNPGRTKLLKDAEKAGKKAVGGLYMLISQGAEAAKLFSGTEVSTEKKENAYKKAEEILNENSGN